MCLASMTDASVLHDSCAGYMARLARHRDRTAAAEIPCLADPALERMRRACARKFPEAVARSQLEKDVRGFERWVEGGGAGRALAEL